MPWIVQILGCTKDAFLHMDDLEDNEDFEEAELSVIRKSNKHGRRSYGWDDENKIIMPDLNPCDKGQRQKLYRMAEVMCEAFNKEAL
jgi:hypothetical protein